MFSASFGSLLLPQTSMLFCFFPLSLSLSLQSFGFSVWTISVTRPTNQPTNRPTDRVTCRVAFTRLKTEYRENDRERDRKRGIERKKRKEGKWLEWLRWIDLIHRFSPFVGRIDIPPLLVDSRFFVLLQICIKLQFGKRRKEPKPKTRWHSDSEHLENGA